MQAKLKEEFEREEEEREKRNNLALELPGRWDSELLKEWGVSLGAMP